jgi:hypothetical protein
MVGGMIGFCHGAAIEDRIHRGFYYVTSRRDQIGPIFWDTVRRLERMVEGDGKLRKELNGMKTAMA